MALFWKRASERFGRRRVIAAAVVAALILLPPIGMGGWAIGIRLAGNVHAVEPGELYRSAQLDGGHLTDVIHSYNIKTVLNLRGKNTGRSWYDDEIKASTAAGVQHIDLAMSAYSAPTPAVLAKLVDILKTAPRPILLHCQAGADRSGLASALYELVVKNKPPAEADKQLSFYFGHFPWLGSKTVAMDDTFEKIAANPALIPAPTAAAVPEGADPDNPTGH